MESKGRGFLPSGRPIILYERHIFFKRVAAFNHANATKWAAAYPSICNKQYGGYVGGEDEWPRLLEAAKLNSDVAHESASYGLFQIMGFHWKSLGYSSVNDFVSNMGKHEANQLNAFVRFIKTNPVLHAALKKKDWAEVARLYNGADYARNRYDVKLAAAYEASW